MNTEGRTSGLDMDQARPVTSGLSTPSLLQPDPPAANPAARAPEPPTPAGRKPPRPPMLASRGPPVACARHTRSRPQEGGSYPVSARRNRDTGGGGRSRNCRRQGHRRYCSAVPDRRVAGRVTLTPRGRRGKAGPTAPRAIPSLRAACQ